MTKCVCVCVCVCVCARARVCVCVSDKYYRREVSKITRSEIMSLGCLQDCVLTGRMQTLNITKQGLFWKIIFTRESELPMQLGPRCTTLVGSIGEAMETITC